MSCSLGEGTNETFEEEEKRFQSEDSEVKFFHVFSRNRIRCIFSGGNSRDINTLRAFKTIQRKHRFASKVNSSHYDGTTQVVGCVIKNRSDAMQVELMDENDDTMVISMP